MKLSYMKEPCSPNFNNFEKKKQMGATWNWKRSWRHLLLIAAFSRPLGKIVEIRSTCLGLDQFQMNENVTRLVIFTLEGGVTKGGYNWGGVYMEASKVLPL